MNNEIEIKGMGKIKFEKLIDKNKNPKGMPKRNKIRIFETMPINLVSQYRYDVFIKYYYVQAYITKSNFNFAKKVYLNHIKSFNNFVEPDGRKINPNDFIKNFNDLIDSVKKEGIDKTIIPITPNGEIIDGAHRLSVALYLNLKIHFAIFDLLDANYGKDFFINRGFNQEYAKIIDKEIIKRLI